MATTLAESVLCHGWVLPGAMMVCHGSVLWPGVISGCHGQGHVWAWRGIGAKPGCL